MITVNYNDIAFLKSVNQINQLPPDIGAEVAFGGRSNSGKSSALNKIAGIHRLARTSKTPGRTQLINFFQLSGDKRLVDLPGYGYAKVPEKVKLHWEKLLSKYIEVRESLKGIILLMDIRHPLKPLDLQMVEWTVSQALPTHILLTKADKLKRGAANQTLATVQKALSEYEEFVTVQLFSSFNGMGIDEVKVKLNEWFQEENKQ